LIKREIFRQYDIRGRAGEELNDDAVLGISRAFAKYVFQKGRKTVIVGRDNRFSSPGIQGMVLETLLASGLDVVDLGVVISPMFYFAARHLDIDAGIMITASHNPGPDNGFKLLLGSSTIYGDEIQELADWAMRGERLNASKRGSLQEIDIKISIHRGYYQPYQVGGAQAARGD
jgi:phosphomannomutase (EC 5.4.2.8)